MGLGSRGSGFLGCLTLVVEGQRGLFVLHVLRVFIWSIRVRG